MKSIIKPYKLTRGALAAMLTLILACAPAYANGPEEDYIPDDTDGTEMQVETPSQLELLLGADWAGAEFRLATDAGEYPAVLPVADDGTLRLEIGGSSTYTLSLIETPASPVMPSTPEPAATPEPTKEPAEEEESEAETEEEPEESEEKQSRGVPVGIVVAFGVGLLIAVGVLVGMRVFSKRRGGDEYDEDGENDG